MAHIYTTELGVPLLVLSVKKEGINESKINNLRAALCRSALREAKGRLPLPGERPLVSASCKAVLPAGGRANMHQESLKHLVRPSSVARRSYSALE